MESWYTRPMQHTTQRSQIPNTTNQTPTTQIRVIVRKRPLNKKEINKCYDIASCLCGKNGQKVVIHEPKASEWWCPCWCVCVCVCVCVFVYTLFLGYFETDWDTLWHKVSFYVWGGFNIKIYVIGALNNKIISVN